MGAQPDGLLELLTGQDWLSVTGSWETAYALRRHPVIAINAIRFTAEADSLNAVIRGEDVTPDDPEFAIFVKGLLAEMTQKAGQKCTAICRVFVPCKQLNDLEAAVSERLAKIIVWNPSDESVRMGPLASLRQREDVRASIAKLEAGGAGCSAIRSQSRKPWPPVPTSTGVRSSRPCCWPKTLTGPSRHTIETFEPVATLLPHKGIEAAIGYVALGEGSLFACIVTADEDLARRPRSASHRGTASAGAEPGQRRREHRPWHGSPTRCTARSWPCRWRRGTSRAAQHPALSAAHGHSGLASFPRGVGEQ